MYRKQILLYAVMITNSDEAEYHAIFMSLNPTLNLLYLSYTFKNIILFEACPWIRVLALQVFQRLENKFIMLFVDFFFQ